MGVSDKDPRKELLQAWYMDESDEDQRLLHHKNPKEFVSLDKLPELGDLIRCLDADNYVYNTEPPHDDLMVITVQIANCQVHRVLIDTGSSVDILFKGTLESFNLKNSSYNSCTTLLHGFTGDSVMPIGSMILPVLIGEAPLQQNIMTNFVVVDIPSTYGAILGKPFLSGIRGVLSIYDNVLNFPVGNEMGEVRGGQQAARNCYAVSTNPTALAKKCAHVTNVLSGELSEEDHKSLGVNVMRLFVGDPVWSPYNHPHDHLPARKEYVQGFLQKDGGDLPINAAA